MKLLVTGCAGFIGANFVNYILDTYGADTVVGVDSLTYAANRSALDELTRRERFCFYKADICDKEAIFRIFEREKPEIVVNFAAESHVDNSISDSAPFLRTNVLGTQVLLDASLMYKVRRFHQISTDEVYGDLPCDSADSFDESSPLLPSSPYSASKAAADLLTLAYHRTHRLPVTISRSSNNFGKYQHKEKLIPKIIEYALRCEPIPIYGDGQNIRDWMHVNDHCRAVDLIIRTAPDGMIYNVGAGNSYTNLEITRAIFQHLGLKSAKISFVPDRLGHDRKYAISCIRLCELGWRPEADFDSALSETVNYYAQNLK